MKSRDGTLHVLARLGQLATWLPIIVLGLGLAHLLWRGLAVLHPGFLWQPPAPVAAEAGIGPALAGSLWLLMLSAALSVPIGTLAGIYLEEWAPAGLAARLVDRALAHLGAMPTVVYGLLGLELFVRVLSMGKTIAAGALTLALLSLPPVIEETRAALRRVPRETRDAALALGASPWAVLRLVIWPLARPSAGVARALARALGETAPLMVLGTYLYANFSPMGPGGPLLSLPVQAFQWLQRGQPGFADRAAAAILVLLALHIFVYLPWSGAWRRRKVTPATGRSP